MKPSVTVIRNDISTSLKSLGWSQGELARRINVHPNTVTAWARDRVEITGPAKAYIELAMKVAELAEIVK